ncbi:CotH kinase family protein [Murimonas intestini]|uniref:CotH kinase family protein n=1 Tax=Murimonas intestini TaxID=1337051 RepID=UPI0011DD4D99|nr:CotH kinase family protein [Murimonas intestini]
MSGSKHFERIAWVVTVLTLAVTILFLNGASLGIEAMEHTMGYEDRLFDNTRVHNIDIVMNNWDEFIANATSEEYYAANVVIDGEACKNVGIRAKGNTSLSTVATLGSERYSFKIEFDKYDSTKSYHGLDKLSLNNLIQDSTMMKDYLTYTMMGKFGVNSSLCSFIYITVNGEDWGLYLAVEGVEEAFLERNYGSGYGELYKPDSMNFGGGRGNGMDFDPSAMFGTEGSGGFSFGGGFGMGSSDVKLQYIDDQLDSYSNIWNNAKTDITEADQRRLIEALKKLSNGEDIESVIDIDQVIRYFVVHNYVCNDDSYTGMMVHNYYLYEEDSRLAMIPWDYNLGFGTFSAGDATTTVNTPIDTPVSGGSSDRPMLNWIFENEEYTQLYHQYFSEFIETTDITDIINNTYNLIKPYVEEDPTAFYTCEEFELGVQTLRQFCEMRSESISMQLENTETTNNMSYVDASAITLSDMGSMGGGMGGFGGDMPGFPENMPENMPKDMPENIPENMSENIPENMPKNMPENMPENFTGEMPEGFDPSNLPDDFSDNFMGQSSGNKAIPAPSDSSDSAGDINTNDPSGGNPEIPGSKPSFDMKGAVTSSAGPNEWIWLAVSIVILSAGLIVAKKYKR